MNGQIVNVGITRESLVRTLTESGLWSGESDSRYGYTLSPCAYGISKKQARELEYLSRGIYRALKLLDRRLNSLGSDPGPNKADARFLRLSKTGTKNLLSPRDCDSNLPPVVKVDLVQDCNGAFKVAEVDAYNPRGLGYLCLLGSTVGKEVNRFPGIGVLCSLFASMRRGTTPWFIIVSEYERYYEPAFGVLVKTLQEYGIPAKLVRESYLAERGVDEVFGTFAQILCVPESLYTHPQVRSRLMERYRRGSIYSLFPPKAYLGSKGFLPYLSQQESAEAYIPTTSLVSRRDDPYVHIDKEANTVLKATVSSGMKQVFFSDLDTSDFQVKLAEARSLEYPVWVLQEQIPQTPSSVDVYSGYGCVTQGDYYFRVIAHITEYGILDVEVTGRPDRKVHGAPDCIQLPSILV